MADIAAGAIDVVVVYKIDRLSRSLIDFSSLLGRFDAYGVSFVSVTQAFDTSHSMGRLTLNVLLSFAQFERELASERLRDKAAAARANGLWQGGGRPFGYLVDKGRLTVHEDEAEVVRHIFRRYAHVGSCRLLAEEMTVKGFRDRRGQPFKGPTLRNYLNSRLYRGDLVHRGRAMPGVHKAIVSEAVWVRAREAVAQVAARHRRTTGPLVANPLKGRLFGRRGESIRQDFTYNRFGTKYRYYVPSRRRPGVLGEVGADRFRADELDEALIAAVLPWLPSAIVDRCEGNRMQILRRFVTRVDIEEEGMVIRMPSGDVVRVPVAGRVRLRMAPSR